VCELGGSVLLRFDRGEGRGTSRKGKIFRVPKGEKTEIGGERPRKKSQPRNPPAPAKGKGCPTTFKRLRKRWRRKQKAGERFNQKPNNGGGKRGFYLQGRSRERNSERNVILESEEGCSLL